MRRRVAAAALCLVASAGALARASTEPPRASLSHFVCRQAQNPKHRDLSVTAVMRPVSGTQHMAIKFELQRQSAGSQSFGPVRGPGLGTWITPRGDPTLGQRPADVWNLHKQVMDLVGPAVYRLRVEFRWSAAQGHVLGRAQRTTSICRAD